MLLLSLDLAFSLNNFTLFDCENKEAKLLYGENRGKKSLEVFPAIFETLGVEFDKVDAFAVNVGVGYSTGLRIAVSMVKTYAQVSEKPLITFTSCEALLGSLPLIGTFLVIFKVSRYFVGGIWKKENSFPEGIEYPIILKGENFEEITSRVDGIVIPAAIAAAFKSSFNYKGELLEVANESLSYGGAFVSCDKLRKGLTAELLSVEPLYFRPPV